MQDVLPVDSVAGPSVKVNGSGQLLMILMIHQLLGALCFPISKFGLEFIEPFAFAFYRFVISSVVLFIVVKLTPHEQSIEKKDYWRIIGLGFLIIPFNQVTYLVGQSMTAAGHGALLFATVPIWIFLAALVYLKEKLVLRRAIGIAVAIIGVVIVMTAGAVRIGTEYLVGDLIIIVAVLAWAYYSILGKPLAQKYGAIRVTAYALISGSLMYFPFGLYFASRLDYQTIPFSAWLSVIYMAVGVSVVAYIIWYWVLKQMDASRIAVFHNVQPLIASAVAYFWLGEPLGLSFIVGGSVALAGVIIAET